MVDGALKYVDQVVHVHLRRLLCTIKCQYGSVASISSQKSSRSALIILGKIRAHNEVRKSTKLLVIVWE